jgi:uncharacterized DUF497 family protein
MTSGRQADYTCSVCPFVWSHDKNALLIAERGISFEAVVAAIEAGELLDVLAHPNPERYTGQRILVVRLHDDAHLLVPFVETADGLLLKTIIPSRKATRRTISET